MEESHQQCAGHASGVEAIKCTQVVMEQTKNSGIPPSQLSAEQEQQLAGDLTQLDKTALIALVEALRRERTASPGTGTAPSSAASGT